MWCVASCGALNRVVRRLYRMVRCIVWYVESCDASFTYFFRRSRFHHPSIVTFFEKIMKDTPSCVAGHFNDFLDSPGGNLKNTKVFFNKLRPEGPAAGPPAAIY